MNCIYFINELCLYTIFLKPEVTLFKNIQMAKGEHAYSAISYAMLFPDREIGSDRSVMLRI